MSGLGRHPPADSYRLRAVTKADGKEVAGDPAQAALP
jgi:hypothetical protein